MSILVRGSHTDDDCSGMSELCGNCIILLQLKSRLLITMPLFCLGWAAFIQASPKSIICRPTWRPKQCSEDIGTKPCALLAENESCHNRMSTLHTLNSCYNTWNACFNVIQFMLCMILNIIPCRLCIFIQRIGEGNSKQITLSSDRHGC